MVWHDLHFQDVYRKICSILCEQLLQPDIHTIKLILFVYTLDTILHGIYRNRRHYCLIYMLCSCLYDTMFYQLTQLLFCPSSITCVNSMDASYIPIAEARGFTTHWIKNILETECAAMHAFIFPSAHFSMICFASLKNGSLVRK